MPLIKETGTCRVEDIEKRAYEIYVAREREGKPGNAFEDWLQAERELNTQAQLYRTLA
jgi:hypothetical protein